MVQQKQTTYSTLRRRLFGPPDANATAPPTPLASWLDAKHLEAVGSQHWQGDLDLSFVRSTRTEAAIDLSADELVPLDVYVAGREIG